MAKRLSREEKQNQLIVDLINKMFVIAGHSVTYDDVLGRTDDWYCEWTMTVKQYDEWCKWGRTLIMKKLRVTTKMAERQMLWVGMMWGLKIKAQDESIL